MKTMAAKYPRALGMGLALLALTLPAPAWQAPNPLRLLPWMGRHARPARVRPSDREPEARESAPYVIGPGDVLAIDVWHEKEISQTLPVRPDGKISLPLAGTLEASGRTPRQLQREITTKLAAFISHPVVTVMVAHVGSRKINVLGAVLRPGSYPLDTPTRVLGALAEAGGFTAFANRSKMIILHTRRDGQQVRYRFNYPAVIHGRKLAENRLLQPGDTLIVP